MEVVYSLTRNDLWAFSQFHATRKRAMRWLAVFGNVIFTCSWFLQLALLFQHLRVLRYVPSVGPRLLLYALEAQQRTLLTFLITTLLLLYVFWFQKFLGTRRLGDPFRLAQPKRMRIGADGIEIATDGKLERVPWSRIPEVASDRERVYLYLGPANALVIPKRAFGNPDAARAFEAAARHYRSDPHLETTSQDEKSSGVWPPPPSRSSAPTATAGEPHPDLEPVPGTVEVPYTTTRVDHWRAIVFFLPRQSSALLSIFVPYFLAGTLYASYHTSLVAGLGWGAAVGVVSTVVTLLWTTGRTIAIRFRRFPGGRPCRVLLRPDLLCDITPETRFLVRWPEVKSVHVLFGDIFILPRSGGGLVVPRSAFPNAAETREFLATLRRYWEAGRQPSPASLSADTTAAVT